MLCFASSALFSSSGMRGRVHHRPDGGELPEHQGEPGLAARVSGSVGLDRERQQANGARQSEDCTTHEHHSYPFSVQSGTGDAAGTDRNQNDSLNPSWNCRCS